MTQPYYQDDWVTLYHGDCIEIDAWQLLGDVLVTDPPYGVAYESNQNRDPRNKKQGRPIAGDTTTELRDTVLRMWGTRPALVFGKWSAPRPTGTRTRLIWDKSPCGFMGDVSIPWGPADEEIYVLGHGFVGRREPNIIRCMIRARRSDRPDHPTPKPVALMEALIVKCPPGIVVDPFAGSGSTLVAAKALGRKTIGVEIEERYCEVIANRLSQDTFDFEETA